MTITAIDNLIGTKDINSWDGLSDRSFIRRTSTGGNLTNYKVGNTVDVLSVYGDHGTRDSATINAAATKMDLVSTEAVDKGTASPGIGARTVTIYGLEADGTAVSETVTLAGATPVQTVNTYYRINNMRVTTVGTSLAPVGDLTLSETGGTTYKYGFIRAGFTRQRTAIYTVPKAKVLYIESITFAATSGAAGHWLRYTLRATYDEKSNTVLSAGFYMPHIEVQIQDQAFTRDFHLPIKFPAGTDIKVSGIADASGADEVCSLQLRGWLGTA